MMIKGRNSNVHSYRVIEMYYLFYFHFSLMVLLCSEALTIAANKTNLKDMICIEFLTSGTVLDLFQIWCFKTNNLSDPASITFQVGASNIF